MTLKTLTRTAETTPRVPAGPIGIIVRPPETDFEKIGRLEREIAACIRNHALLRRGMPQVHRNNERLRSGIRDLVASLPADDDLLPVAEKLRDALLIPFAYERPEPAETIVDETPPPEDPGDRIAFLQARLSTLGRSNYLIQEAGAPVVWNSDAIRAVLAELRDELSPRDVEDEPENPLTLEQAMIMAIVDGIDAVMKAGADRPDK